MEWKCASAILFLTTLGGGATGISIAPSSGVEADSLRFEIDVPPEVRLGEPVPVQLCLTNATDQPITVYLQGRPTAFDILVTDNAGAKVWRRLEGHVIAAILGIRMLEPGELISFEDVWPQRDDGGKPVGPGTYSIVGLLPTDGPEPLRTGPKRIEVITP